MTYSCAEIWVDFCVEIWVDFCVEAWVDFRVEIWVDFRVEIVGTDRPTDQPRTECLLEATQPSLKKTEKHYKEELHEYMLMYLPLIVLIIESSFLHFNTV